ncbi:transposase [Streptococcus anginosus]|uniref:transposase n=1 Tax=Streptococcus anginosus TaxID=1328 RepID=UPI000D047182|nr:transposase [Streptococcus anginosus]MCW1035311.1 transposase [Streptococcus anginosus]PRT75068.1 transposase [Streptococcus anginosus]VTS43758.1 transposase [Streptococcus anginosus]
MVKKRIRNVIKQVFLSEEENQKLLERMKQDGFSNFSRFARKQLLKPNFEVWIVRFPEYLSLTDRLLSVGRTINSIARGATQFGKISQQDLMELGRLMEELVELVEEQLKEDKQRIAKK